MNYRLGLCLAAIAITIVAVSVEGGLLEEMTSGFQHRTARRREFRDSSSASSLAYSSGDKSVASAEAKTGNGQSGYAQGSASTGRNRQQRGPRSFHHHDKPAPFVDYEAPRAGFGASFAKAEAQSAYGSSGAGASAYSQGEFMPRYRRPNRNSYPGRGRSLPVPEAQRPSSPSVPTTPDHQFSSAPSVSSSFAATNGVAAAAGAVGNAGSSTSATVSSGNPKAGQHASAQSGNSGRPGRSYGYYGDDDKREPYGREGSVSSTAASAKARAGPASAAMASAQHDVHEIEDEEEEESFSIPETVKEYSASAGSYADNGPTQESGSYVRAYEDDESYEEGDEESDNYFAAKSHAKAYDEDIQELTHANNEEVIQGKDYTRTQKNSFFRSINGKISDHETGSNVKGKDKYRAQYKQGNRRVRDYTDQAYNRNGSGAVVDNHLSDVSGFDQETDDYFDSRGTGNFVDRKGVRHARRPNLAAKAAAAATASASASSAGVTSSTSARKS